MFLLFEPEKMRKKFILFCICSFFIIESTVAKPDGIFFQEFYPKYGALIQSPRSESTISSKNFLGGVYGIGYQTVGNNSWETFFKHPRYGFRLGFTNYFDSEVFGQSISLNTFIQAPFFRINKFSFEYSMGLGIGLHSKKYNLEKNLHNDYVSTNLTANIDLSLIQSYELSPKIDVFVGENFSHYSNGAVHLPNLGINGVSVFAGMRYYQNSRKSHVKDDLKDKTVALKNEVYTFYAPGFLQYKIDNIPENFFASTLEFGYKRRFHPCMKWGAGIDIIYTGYEMYENPDNLSYKNNFSQSIFGSFDLLLGDISLQAALGYYTYYSAKPRGRIYERIGVFYNFGDKFKQFTGVSIKASMGRADYIEWTYGFRIKTF